MEAFLVGACGRTEAQAARTSFRELRLLREGKEQERKDRYELARWIAFHIYSQNPYIKPPRAHTAQSCCRFPWEETTEEEAREAAERCRVTPEEEAKLNEIFEKIMNQRQL